MALLSACPAGSGCARLHIVHSAVVRPATGERFEAYVAPSAPLAPSFEAHSKLISGRISRGESRVSFAHRLRAFFRPDDVLASWGFYGAELLNWGKACLPPLLDVREAAIRASAAESGSSRITGGPWGRGPRAPWAAGRTGTRLSAIEALVSDCVTFDGMTGALVVGGASVGKLGMKCIAGLSRRTRLLALFGLASVFAGGLALVVGPVIRSRAVSAARQRGFEIEIGRVGLGLARSG